MSGEEGGEESERERHVNITTNGIHRNKDKQGKARIKRKRET